MGWQLLEGKHGYPVHVDLLTWNMKHSQSTTKLASQGARSHGASPSLAF